MDEDEYLINTTINTKDCYGGNNIQQFIFKIYKNGNVIVTHQYKDCRTGNSPVWTILEIKDNIPLPEYVISILKILLQTSYVPQTINEYEKYQSYYKMLIDVLKTFKEQKYVETNQIEEVENKLNNKIIYIESLENEYTESLKVIEELKKQNTMKDNHINNIETEIILSKEVNKELESKNKSLTEETNRLKDNIMCCSKKCWCYHNAECKLK